MNLVAEHRMLDLDNVNFIKIKTWILKFLEVKLH